MQEFINKIFHIFAGTIFLNYVAYTRFHLGSNARVL